VSTRCCWYGSSLNVSFLWHGTGGQFSGGLPGTLQELAIEGTCSAPAQVDAASGFTNSGFIELAATGCASDASISMPGTTLTNKGLINVLSGSIGGARVISGNLAQQKNIGFDHNVTLYVNGDFVQVKKTIFRTLVFGDNDFGSLSVSGSATLNGTLSVVTFVSYKPSVGAMLPIVAAASRSGVFSKAPKLHFGARYLAPSIRPPA
jgi:hypothetical protein